MKRCNKCGVEQDESCFRKDIVGKDGLRTICKLCDMAYSKLKGKCPNCGKHQIDNFCCIMCKNSLKQCSKCQIIKNKSEFNKHSKNKDGLQFQCKNCRKKYRQQNKEKMFKHRQSSEVKNRQRQHDRDKYYNNPQYKLRKVLRSRLTGAINKGCKSGSAVRDLGCSIEECKIWLENQFLPGMTWENWSNKEGCWSIDHVKPLHLFDLTNREEFLQACHYTNLRPMWHIDNISRTYEEFAQNPKSGV
jgi:hypothetical protein